MQGSEKHENVDTPLPSRRIATFGVQEGELKQCVEVPRNFRCKKVSWSGALSTYAIGPNMAAFGEVKKSRKSRWLIVVDDVDEMTEVKAEIGRRLQKREARASKGTKGLGTK